MTNLLYLALGSNIGNRVAHIHQALRLLSLHGSITNTSFLYQSAPMYYSAQDTFLNAVVEYRTNLEAEQALDLFQSIERQLGRDYQINKGPRSIDVDMLLYNQEVVDTARLQVPHKDMLERDFVVTPLLDIDQSIVHPLLKQPVREVAQVEQPNGMERVLGIDKAGEEVVMSIDGKAYSMGIVNVSPDSFHSSLHMATPSSLWQYASHFDLVDIGGESSRPGSQPISADEEIDRLTGVMGGTLPDQKVISLDTRKPEVSRHFQDRFHIINDVSGQSQQKDMVAFAVESMKPLVMTHNLDGQHNLIHDDPANHPSQVAAYFQAQTQYYLSQGIPRWNLIFDIGLGFNKSLDNNMALMRDYQQVKDSLQGMPSLIGFSNKGSFGRVFGNKDRANHVMAGLAYSKGATLVRLHDPEVAATLQALNLYL